MKSRSKILLSLTTILAIMIMSSCKKGMTDLPANANENALTAETSMNPNAERSSTLLLTKVGNTALNYQRNKLASVDYGNGKVKTYTYTSSAVFKQIIATETLNGKKTNKTTYILNASGLCTKMKYQSFDVLGNVLVNGEYNFTYENGRLIAQVGDKDFGDRYEFTYDGKGRLVWFRMYDTEWYLIGKMHYQYGDKVLEAEIPNKNQINPEDAFIDDFQKIFGVFSNDLVRQKLYYDKDGNIEWGEQYNYSLNNYSYPTERKTYNLFAWALKGTIAYSYKSPN